MDMKKVCVGVIGSGAISDTYLKNMTSKFQILEVKAIADIAMDKAKIQADKYHIKACTVEELLLDNDIEMVLNLTPASIHYEMIKKALNAGKHVYTEKSLTDSLETARELVALAKEKELYLGSAPDTFMCSWLQTARNAIDSGMLGEITSFAIAANRDNDLLLSLFGFLRKPGAGVCYDYAVYYLTALISLLGPVDRTMAVVKAPYQTHINILEGSPEYGQVMDTPNESQAYAILELENGVTGTLHLNADSVFFDQAYFAIYGKKGVLYLSNPDWFSGTVRFLPNGYDHANHPKQEVLPDPYAFKEDCRGVGMAEMAWAIREERKNRASGELAYHVLDIVECMIKSSETESFCKVESSCERPIALRVPTDREESSLTLQ